MATTPRHVMVTGAAGFIGRRVVPELVRRGWSVRAFVHPADANVFSGCAGVTTFVGDVRDVDVVHTTVSGTEAAVSLAACKMDEPESHATNVGGAQHLVAACRVTGVQRIINVSTQSAKLPRPGLYGRTKREADAVFEDSGLAVTTLRPSLVYGPDDPGVFGTVQRFVDRLPVVPICGDGRWLSAPLHVDDVARAIVDCLEEPSTIGRTYDIGGPDLIPFDALIDQIAAHLGRQRRKIHLPVPFVLPIVRAVTALWPGAPVSVSNVLGSTQDTGIDSAPAGHDFAFTPRPLEQGLHDVFGSSAQRALRAEAARLARHLLGITVTPVLRDRYVDACLRLFGEHTDASVRFVRRHPWALACLDGALGVFRRDAQLRHRILLMAAILEASPDFADWFLRAPPSKPRLVARLCWRGLTAGARTTLGMLLLPFVGTGKDAVPPP